MSPKDQLFLRKLIYDQFSTGYFYFGLTCFLLAIPLWCYQDSVSVLLTLLGIIAASWIVNYFLVKKEKMRFERNLDRFFFTDVENWVVEVKIAELLVRELADQDGCKSTIYHYFIESDIGSFSFSRPDDSMSAGVPIRFTLHAVRITCFEKEAFNHQLFAFKRDGIYLEELIELIPHPD